MLIIAIKFHISLGKNVRNPCVVPVLNSSTLSHHPPGPSSTLNSLTTYNCSYQPSDHRFK